MTEHNDARQGPRSAPSRRSVLNMGTAGLAAVAMPHIGRAQAGPVKIGVTLPLSGQYASEGKQTERGIQLFQKLNGVMAGGRKVEVTVRDDQGPSGGDLARRLMQEMVVRDEVDILAGFSFTPQALSVVNLINETKKPAIIMNAATSIITTRSPWFVRVSWTLAQASVPLGDWAAKNKLRRVYSLVSDFAPGLDAERFFKKGLEEAGGEIIGSVRVPLQNIEYGPYLQRARDAKPDALFAFLPGGDLAVSFMKAVRERDFAGANIQLLVTGDVVEDDKLPIYGATADGVISSLHYSMAHESPENARFVKEFGAAFGAGERPNFRSVGAYDGMTLIYRALEQTKGDTNPEKLLAALKGQKLLSPRGPMEIDAETRDIVQTVYLRKTQNIGGEWQNIEFASYPTYKDPGKL